MKFLKALSLAWGLFSAGLMLLSCNNDDEASVSVNIKLDSAENGAMNVVLTTSGISNYAYACFSEDPAYLDESVIFKGSLDGGICGSGSISSKKTSVSIFPLEVGTKYTAYFAFERSDGEYYGQVLTLSASVSEYTDFVTLVGTSYDGFAVHIEYPDEVQEGNVLKYACRNIAMYSDPYVDALFNNGDVYITGDTTIVYNNDNIYYEGYANGEDVFHDQIAPGEPMYFLVGEFSWGEPDWIGFDTEGYHTPLYDMDAEEWTGVTERIFVRAKEPEVLDASLNITYEAGPASGVVYVDPDDEIVSWSVMVMQDAVYQDEFLPMLDNNEDYVQWFVTSYYAYYYNLSASDEGRMQIIMEDNQTIIPETTYHIFAVGYGDSNATTQCFEHYTFNTPAPTLDPPEVEVTALTRNPTTGERDPFSAWFNIKAPNGDLASAKWAANYERGWASMLKYYTYSEILTTYGTSFSSTELAAINSSDGYDMCVSSVDNTTTRMAVLGYNSEETSNDIDEADTKAIASCTTIMQPDATKVESDLYEALSGNWEATFTASAYDSSAGASVSASRTIDVVISSEVNDYPETLPDDVYDLFDDMTSANVDAYYEAFKEEAEIFNKRLSGQNRLLCLGFGVNMPVMTAYELFCADSDTYNGYDSAATFYDFGPKWYLQIEEDGSVTAPFNMANIYPLSSWMTELYTYVSYYFCARKSDASYTDGVLYYDAVTNDDDSSTTYNNLSFPVTVSEDRKTITIEPLVTDGVTYYPNAGTSAGVFGYGSITSSIVLTKVDDDDASAASLSSVSPSSVKAVRSKDGKALERPAGSVKSRTIMTCEPKKEYKQRTINVLTKETFAERNSSK